MKWDTWFAIDFIIYYITNLILCIIISIITLTFDIYNYTVTTRVFTFL